MVSKMGEEERFVSLVEATQEVGVAITRLALLHLSFSKTLVEELGEKKGKELVIRSILEYGKRVGERTKRGLPDLPKYGVHGGWKDRKLYDCVLAKIFQEYGEEDIGCLYCYVDPVKSMTADPYHKTIHKDCAACGDDYCTFELAPTTKKERADFKSKGTAWRNVDPRLAQGSKPKNPTKSKKA
jgi:hypothetical protein